MIPIIENLLRRRGVQDLEKFLHPKLADLCVPEALPGVVEAADAILKAVADGRQCVVFGDYDCDGVCATAILVRVLSAIAGSERTNAFLPNRLSEGYGMSEASVGRMLAEYPDVGLVITVDNGINSVEQVKALAEKGVPVVITDHHLPGDVLPDALALVNPKVSAPEELRDLCGAAVAYLLASRIVSEAKRRGLYSAHGLGGPLLVLAGLATVTDIMPLVGQNRILVIEALRRFHSWAPVGLRELHQRAAKRGAERMTSKDFGFLIGPRINAAGRLATGAEALELVITEDREIARECARIVDGYNNDRKSIEQKMSDEALSKVVAGAPAQVIDLPGGHPGVAGIVAARVLEKLGGKAPVCVIASGHGSARSPSWLNIRDAFVACDSVLERYGGHAAAGGFSVREGKTDEFRRMLCEYCQGRSDLVPDEPWQSAVDAWVVGGDVTLELAEELRQLEPFGEGNPLPVFGFRSVRIDNVTPLGHEGRHLKFTVNGLDAIWWNRADLVERLRGRSAAAFDIGFTLEISDYLERHVEIRIVNMSESASVCGKSEG